MDFQLYSLGAALVFHEIFFPESSTAMALILAMGTYGAGYVARIVGAFIFGKMGDRIGRKKVLFITITMMGICTTLIPLSGDRTVNARSPDGRCRRAKSPPAENCNRGDC